MLKGEHLFSGFFFMPSVMLPSGMESLLNQAHFGRITNLIKKIIGACCTRIVCVFVFFLSMEMSFSENKCSHGCINTSAREKWASTQSACTALGTEQHSDFLKEAPCATTT